MWKSVVFFLALVCLGCLADKRETKLVRTVILMEKPTIDGENLFFRGGVDYSRRENCSTELPVNENPCNLAIRNVIYISPHYAAANAWEYNDYYLDWTGPEPGQGKWKGFAAEGTPAIWTTNDEKNDLYHPLNTYGPHYWHLDIEVNCSNAIDNEFFEVKGFINGGWENDLPQDKSCTGEAGSPSFKSSNHIVRCGYKNVFHFNSPDCIVEQL